MATINFLQKSSDGSTIAGLTDAPSLSETGSTFNLGIGAGNYTLQFNNVGPGNTTVFRFAQGGNKFQFNDLTNTMFEIDSSNAEGGVSSYYGMAVRDTTSIKHLLRSQDANPSYVANGTQNFGIGTTTPSQKLDINGNFTASGQFVGNFIATGNVTAVDCFATSDERLKEDIKPFKAPLSKLRKLGSLLKCYRWKDSKKEDIGLLAQDVKKVFPELVNTDKNGFLSVNYQKLNLMLLQWI